MAPTLLLDGDDTRNVTSWAERGPGFPFKVADEVQAAKLARDYEHVVIDTGQRPKRADLKALADGCDMLVIPAVPRILLDTDDERDLSELVDELLRGWIDKQA